MDFNYLNELDNLQFIPINDKKIPTVKNWQTEIKKHNLSNCYGVGLVCGKSSELNGAYIEALDIDLKYDVKGTLYNRFKNLIHEIDSTLLSKMVVQKTRSGGFHFIYRCAKVEGNLKLANRYATEEEKNETYQKTYEKESLAGKSDADAKKIAEKYKLNDKVRVLLETRGIGGYIAISPTNGYEFVYGDIQSISTISIEERDTLITIARQFNEVVEEQQFINYQKDHKKEYGLSPFEDYNNRGDVVSLLENNGWKRVGQKGNKTLFLRPGQTTALHSGNYDHNRNWFSVFTTSSEFEPQKAYLPYAVFAKLECNGDFSMASRKLLELGYGERISAKKDEKKIESPRATKSRIEIEDDDFSFIADGTDYDNYLEQVIDGTLPMGLTTGCPSLDEHFLFKQGNLVMINGHDNVGKTVVILWKFMLAAMYHDWKFLLFASENTIGSIMRKLIQFYYGKPLRATEFNSSMTQQEYKIAKTFVENHFIIIRSQEDLYNYKDIINMTRKALKKYPDLKCTLIDPYNSLKTDISSFSKLNVHDFNYEALSEIKAFGQKNNYSFYINNHAVTESLRKLDKDGYPVAPNKADTEGGGKAANKADDFITIHRKTQHPTEWMVTELHIRKIKDTETGGKPTQLNFPVKLQMNKNGCGFTEYLEGLGNPIDPIQKWHLQKSGKEIINQINNTTTIIDDPDEMPF